MEYLPPIALVAVFAVVWGGAWLADRRFRRAVADAAPRLNGRYEKGGAATGGTLYGRIGDRDVVLCFTLSTSRNPESTALIVMLRRPVTAALRLKGADAVARIPALRPYSKWYGRAELLVESNLLTVRIHGILRDADRLVALAGTLAAQAGEFES